jgi:hypothetical protein
MQTKSPVFAVALLALGLSGVLCAQQAVPKEISTLLADYRKEFGKAKEPTDKVLRAEAAKIATKLVTDGNADAARSINTQVEDKIAGKQVTAGDASLAGLFARYDSAVVAAAKPIRDKFTSRVDALLKGNMSKDLNAVAALGDAKKVILGEVPAFDSPTDPKIGGSAVTNPARGRKVLSDLVEGKMWEFRTGSGDHLFGFEKRGNKVRWFRTGSNAGLTEYNWSAEDDFIRIGNDQCELRIDVSGTFGEVQFLSSKNRYRTVPSTKTIPGK